MTTRNLRTLVAMLLAMAALALVASVLAGRPWPQEPEAGVVYVLADRSASIAAEDLSRAQAEVKRELAERLPLAEVKVIDFAARPRPVRKEDANATDIAAAIRAALADASSTKHSAIVVLSDGNATAGDTRELLQTAAATGVSVVWRTVSSPIDAPRIADLRAPTTAAAGQRIPIAIELAGRRDRPLELRIAPRGAQAWTTRVIQPTDNTRLQLELPAAGAGPLVLDAVLSDPADGSLADERRAVALVDVRPRASILYVAERPSALQRSLLAGGWSIESAAPGRLDELAGEFSAHTAIVLDDVPTAAARDATWQALLGAVRDAGTGLLVLGGPRSFAAGGYRESILERALPVLSRPAATGAGIAIVFAVDKSGSMGASASGVDRFALAQRAVADSAASLTERDSAAVVAFDVEARNLVPLQAAGEFRRAVRAPWPAQPRGGTRLEPAIEAALAQFEAAGTGRRILVLVTDGFVGDVPIESISRQLAAAQVEVVALAIGPDADVAALSRLATPDRLTILRVAEAAELPALMRAGLETRRAPVQRERSAVRVRNDLPFIATAIGPWPPVAAYAVTAARPDAVTWIESLRGDPVIAFRQFGSGRVVAVTSGLGAWTGEWMRWARWPEFAGGLADWVARGTSHSGSALQVTEHPGRLSVHFDSAAAGEWVAPEKATLLVRAPSGQQDRIQMQDEAPGRVGATVIHPEPGLYEFMVPGPQGIAKAFHLHSGPRELDSAGPNPELADWEHEGLLQSWSPEASSSLAADTVVHDPSPQRALLLAFLLFIASVLADRAYLARRRA